MSDFKKNDSKSIAQFKLASEKSKKKIIFNGVLYESITDLVRSIDIAESTIHIQLSRQGGKNDKDCYVLNYVKPLPRKVSISGKVFNSTADAAIALDIKRPILKSRIRSKANLDCFYINT